MSHVTPFILAAGQGVQGSSLGYHAYSLRVDNLSNQWLQEESSLVWIPPYSLGVVLRLWGTSVALLIPAAPIGQAQLAPIAGEYAVAVFSDEFRTENPGVPVRQFTLVQAVSDLTEGPQPALPPLAVDRLYADPAGNIHHLHSDGTDLILYDIKQPLGGVLTGFLPNPGLAAGAVSQVQSSSGVLLESTTSASMAAMQIPVVNITTAGGVVLAWFTATFSNSAAAGGSLSSLGLRVDAGAFSTLWQAHSPGASFSFGASFAVSLGVLAAGAHTLNIGWAVGGGFTLQTIASTTRSLVVVELKR